ncbi:unnamed protein product [Cylicocyclus nassatus]|uniref:Uncharacterized protein n=1 Tax=Cylicocyclus nassatus TaxID=53992 RepID=A0AA36HAI6_CYLNA|nr:unnamed protein product [Cylicocyclus nassatus]
MPPSITSRNIGIFMKSSRFLFISAAHVVFDACSSFQMRRDPLTSCNITKEALSKAAEAVHLLRPYTFDIRCNPDCFSNTVKHASGEDLEKLSRKDFRISPRKVNLMTSVYGVMPVSSLKLFDSLLAPFLYIWRFSRLCPHEHRPALMSERCTGLTMHKQPLNMWVL